MIKIEKSKLYRVNNKNKKKLIKPTDLFFYLHEEVEIGNGVTFGRIMELLKANEALTTIVFYSLVGDFKLFYKDMIAPIKDNEKRDKKEYLEVYVINDLWKLDKKEKIEYGFYFDIHLIKPNDKEGLPYSISFMPLNKLKDHPIKIDYKSNFQISDTTVPVTKANLKKSIKPVLETKLTSMRLFDFLTGILYEIGWHGYPQERDERGDSIISIAKDIDSGKMDTSTFNSFDDFIKNLDKKKGARKKKKSTSK